MESKRTGMWNGDFMIIKTVENDIEGVALAVKNTDFGREYVTWSYLIGIEGYAFGHYFFDSNDEHPFTYGPGFDSAKQDFYKRSVELIKDSLGGNFEV